MADLIKATVTVVAREGFNGYWSIQRHFPNGQSLHELTAEQIALIQADAAGGLPISIVEGWPKPATAADELAKAEAALAAAKAKADAEAAELAALEAEEQAAAAAKAKGKR